LSLPLLPRARLETAADDLRDWATGSALPLWASAGFDRTHRRFVERLTLDAGQIPDAPIRLIVQGRQIYSYAVAHRRGWFPGALDVVEAAYATMVREYHRPDGQNGWAYTINHDGSVADGRRDLYSTAFALLGIASYVEATGKRQALALADETLAHLDGAMRARHAGGFVEALPVPAGPRRQNPHMHLLEAFLALWQVSSEARYLARATAMVDLFRTHFFQPQPGVLGEYFDERLAPATGEAGAIVEPGHHYEWIWLLRRYEAATGEQTGSFVDALYRHADTNGHAASGLVVDELTSDGRVRLPSHRTWPMTEALKANVVEAERGRPGAGDKARTIARLMLDRFFAGNPPGGWMDRLDERGQPATDFMPASTLYHVICAIDVLQSLGAKA
jgi:mannose/cellobiose epimerase-like protein (N-acyl-D-glucosamine 2-epimerase family)